MATSGSTNYSDTFNDIVKDALIELNANGADENVAAEDFVKAKRTLNRMMKIWQANQYNLWKKKTGTIFLQKDQSIYNLSSTGDHATETYIETTLSADEAIGQTTLSVTSSSDMTVGDYIGVECDDNVLYWATITNIPDSTSVIISTPLTVAASEDNKVYAYTTRLDEPFNVLSANREDENQIEVPMTSSSYQDFFELPNKTSSGSPVQYNYDRQLGTARIKIWPVPQNVSYVMNITYIAKIEDFDSVANTPDFPQEWYEAIVLNLAVKLAASFGKNNLTGFADLRQRAAEALDLVLRFDNESGSLYMQPNSQMTEYMNWGER